MRDDCEPRLRRAYEAVWCSPRWYSEKGLIAGATFFNLRMNKRQFLNRSIYTHLPLKQNIVKSDLSTKLLHFHYKLYGKELIAWPSNFGYFI